VLWRYGPVRHPPVPRPLKGLKTKTGRTTPGLKPGATCRRPQGALSQEKDVWNPRVHTLGYESPRPTGSRKGGLLNCPTERAWSGESFMHPLTPIPESESRKTDAGGDPSAQRAPARDRFHLALLKTPCGTLRAPSPSKEIAGPHLRYHGCNEGGLRHPTGSQGGAGRWRRPF
jgi:hypothetical protein